MKFGVRQICNVVFRANEKKKIGNREYQKGEPVFYIDTAKASSIEGSATTVYAQGGRGNTRLVTWEGEKTLTFSVEDALLSPISFSALSGAGVIKGSSSQKVHVHQTSKVFIEKEDTSTFFIDLSKIIKENEFDHTAPFYVLGLSDDGDLDGNLYTGFSSYSTGTSPVWKGISAEVTVGDPTPSTLRKNGVVFDGTDFEGASVLIDYYVIKDSSTVTELQIDAQNFGGSFYVEADTLFRRKIDNKDLPANITMPNVKIQSNFTFSMSASGDPSTFNFTMDAMPGYTYFNKKKEVLCAIQIIDDVESVEPDLESVFIHDDEKATDSVTSMFGVGATDKDSLT